MLLVFRSTLVPASLKSIVLPSVASAAGEPPGRTYEVAYYPTFTREGSAVADEATPARIIVGEREPGSARALVDLLSGTNAPIFTTSIEAAALTKLADNAFHALKVAFANEIGRFALQSAISPEEVFTLFRADKRLNISEAYLQPGAAFGGPCLPKDVEALVTCMGEAGVAAPVLSHVLGSNALHTEFLLKQVERRTEAGSRVLMLGLSFKTGTDDLRGSPLVAIADALLERERDVSIYDPDLLIGDAPAGRCHSLPPRLLAALLPHPPVGRDWDLVVVGKKTPDLLRVLGGTSAVLHIDRF
jgi:GDP-mannose 6-dehydrogenase